MAKSTKSSIRTQMRLKSEVRRVLDQNEINVISLFILLRKKFHSFDGLREVVFQLIFHIPTDLKFKDVLFKQVTP